VEGRYEGVEAVGAVDVGVEVPDDVEFDSDWYWELYIWKKRVGFRQLVSFVSARVVGEKEVVVSLGTRLT